MGIALWLAAGIVAWFVARIIPILRPAQRLSDLALAVVAALLAGLGATLLDFGGWSEPDWRAGVFALACALAVTGWFRVYRLRF